MFPQKEEVIGNTEIRPQIFSEKKYFCPKNLGQQFLIQKKFESTKCCVEIVLNTKKRGQNNLGKKIFNPKNFGKRNASGPKNIRIKESEKLYKKLLFQIKV